MLKSQLMLLAVSGANPITVLSTAVQQGGLADAHEPAAVLSWRLDRVDRRGPPPWLTGIPDRLAEHPQWGPYLTSRAELVHDLAAQVRATSGAMEHRWQDALSADLMPELVAQVSVWRAAMEVREGNPRPTGSTSAGCCRSLAARPRRPPRALQPIAAALGGGSASAGPAAARLSSLSHQGEGVPALLDHALRRRPLPDDHAASALLYRLERRRRNKLIDDVWEETIEPTERMGQHHERIRPTRPRPVPQPRNRHLTQPPGGTS